MATSEPLKILCVDDEAEICRLMSATVADLGYEALTATGGAQAIELVRQHADSIVFVVSDLRMPEMDGLELRRVLLQEFKDIPFAILSAHVTREIALTGVELKIAAFLDKPVDMDQFAKVVQEESRDRQSLIEEKRALVKAFLEESTDLIEELEPLFLALEASPQDQDTINTIFRLVHTVKGASGVLERDDVTGFLHRYEDLLTQIKNGNILATPDVITVLLRCFDFLGQMVAGLAGSTTTEFDFAPFLKAIAGAGDLQATTASTSSDRKTDTKTDGDAATLASGKKDGITVPTAMLDEFMALSGEITVIRNMVNKLVRSIERKMPSDEDVGLLDDLLDEMHKINGNMQAQITELRKLPLAIVFRRLPRTVRDLSRSLDRPVRLDVSGDNLRVDTAIAQVLTNCLTHMVRNCVDHGIEDRAQRQQAGKPEEGVVQLSATEDGDNVVVRIKDDGKGIDADAIKVKAIEKRVIEPDQAQAMTRQELLQLIFEPGFSTAQKITDVSGRGVGMDMVRASVESLRGRIEMDSEPGKGSEFQIVLPIPKSVVIIQCLTVMAADQAFAVPQERIHRLLRLDRQRRAELLGRFEGAQVLQLDGRLIPVVNLATTLGLRTGEMRELDETARNSEELTMLVIDGEDGELGLLVDSVLDSEDLVVKPLHTAVSQTDTYSGATFMGDGSIGLILDVDGLGRRADVLRTEELDDVQTDSEAEAVAQIGDMRELMMFTIEHPGRYAVWLEEVYRFEEYTFRDLQKSGEQEVVLYRDTLMPVIDLQAALGLGEAGRGAADEPFLLFVVNRAERFFGFRIAAILDVSDTDAPLNDSVADRDGIAGNMIVADQILSLIDIDQVLADAGFAQIKTHVAEPEAAALPATGTDGQAFNPSAGPQVEAESDESSTAETGDGWALF